MIDRIGHSDEERRRAVKIIGESRDMPDGKAALFLFDQYRRSAVRDAFVVSLIGELLGLRARREAVAGADVQHDQHGALIFGACP